MKTKKTYIIEVTFKSDKQMNELEDDMHRELNSVCEGIEFAFRKVLRKRVRISVADIDDISPVGRFG